MGDMPEAPEAGEEATEIRIVITPEGKMSVGWKGLPGQKMVLYGILEVAKDVIRQKLEKGVEGTATIVPASASIPHELFRRNNGRH